MTRVTLNNLLSSGRILYIGRTVVGDTNIPSTTYGAYSMTAVPVANGSPWSNVLDSTQNTIYYFWFGTGTTTPSDTQAYLGALMLNGSTAAVQLINSSFIDIFGQSDGTFVWSIINSTVVSINNQTGKNLFIGYQNVIAGSSVNPQNYPYPFGTTQTLNNGNSININLAYPSSPATTIVHTNTAMGLYTSSNTGALPANLAILNNALGTLINSATNNTLIITVDTVNNYKVTVAATPSSGLPWWAWLLIIGGIVLIVGLLIWLAVSSNSSKAQYKHQSTADGYMPVQTQVQASQTPVSAGMQAPPPHAHQASQVINPVSPGMQPPPPVPGTVVYPPGYVLDPITGAGYGAGAVPT